MSRIAYVNGRYLPHRAASVHVEDRGYQFADGVYEVCEVRGGRLVDERRHMDAARALADRAAHRACRCRAAALGVVLRETIARNRVRDGIVYLQITRGVARRDHAFPPAGTAPSVVVTARSTRSRRAEKHAPPKASRSSPCRTTAGSASTSSRCRCCPTCWPSRRRASRAPSEAWFVDAEGCVTEGSSTNAWIVTRDGTVVTRPADHGILRGITRTVVLDVIAGAGARARGAAVHASRRPMRAREAFVTSASQIVHAGGADRRPAGRQRRARPGRIGAAARLSRHAEIG